MSHRKYIAPRHGSLAFLPRKRCTKGRGRIRSFPPDNPKDQCHLTAFIGYKAGMTHIMRQLNRPSSKAHQKEIVEPVTIIETPPMVVVGMVGYVKTPAGLRSVVCCWAGHIDDGCRRRFYKNWHHSKKKAFTSNQAMWAAEPNGQDPQKVKDKLALMTRYCEVIRVIAHTQIAMLPQLGQKKAQIIEIQINGGSVEEKVKFGYAMFEKLLPVDNVFHDNESIDTIAITKGKGWKGVVSRWGVARLQRKTHRGLRKVACIGSWHPARVQYTIAREGQKGYHHRTMIHKKIYKIGKAIQYNEHGQPINFEASTENDLTQKNITPMGGFVGYGIVKQDFIMIKGSCPGPRKRCITLRKPIVLPTTSLSKEEISLKFIDTSSKLGHGRFQTSEEKKIWLGKTKKDKLKEAEEKAKELKALARKKRTQKAKGKVGGDEKENDVSEKKSEKKKKKQPSVKKGSKKKGSGKKGKGSKKKTQRR